MTFTENWVFSVLTYARFENDTSNPDFIVGNQFSRVGLVENPQHIIHLLLNLDKVSGHCLKLTGIGYSSAFLHGHDSYVTQTVGVGSTAIGRVVSYDVNHWGS